MQLALPFLAAGDVVQAPEVRPADPLPREQPATVFVRNPSARRYILRVRPDGTLRVTIPRRGSRREAEGFVARQHRWIERERSRVLAANGPREWTDGSVILLGGVATTIRLTSDAEGTCATYAGRAVRLRAGESVRKAIERDLVVLARGVLEPRLRELAARHGFTPGRLTVRNQRSRWGSCAASGNIALNFRLVQMPPEVRDYVIVHELMHLQQQNHSRRFWRLVERACPAFRVAERWLRVQGRALF
jgi:predicted metal-dependent hydrolase